MPEPITGQITTFLDALGQSEYEDGGLRLLGLVGPTFNDEDYPGERYRTFTPRGVAVQYKQAKKEFVANAVFVYIEGQDGASPYSTPDQLIDGLPLTTAARADIAARLGKPLDTSNTYDVLGVGERFLHFEYDTDGSLTTVTALVRVPGL